MTILPPDGTCPACGHGLVTHFLDLGCLHGWRWAADGAVSHLGCTCPLTLSSQFGGQPHEGPLLAEEQEATR